MINLILSGRVGKDAQQLENGCVFSLATTKKGYTRKDGTAIPDKTVWFSVFGSKGLAPYIKKGDNLTIYTDWINTEVYEGKANLSCYAVSVEFGGKAQQSAPAQQTASAPAQQTAPAQVSTLAPAPAPAPAEQNEDLPF